MGLGAQLGAQRLLGSVLSGTVMRGGVLVGLVGMQLTPEVFFFFFNGTGNVTDELVTNRYAGTATSCPPRGML